MGVQFLLLLWVTVLVPVSRTRSVHGTFHCRGGDLDLSFGYEGMVPIFGSSFAFIAPIVKATELYGLPGTLSGLAAVGLVYFW